GVATGLAAAPSGTCIGAGEAGVARAGAGASPSWRSIGAWIPISRSHACCSALSTGFSISGASSSIVTQHLTHDAGVFPTPAGRWIVVLAYGHLFEPVTVIKRQRIGIGRPNLEQYGGQTPFASFFLAMTDQGGAHTLAMRLRRHRDHQEVGDVRCEKRHAEADHAALPVGHPAAIAGLEPIGKIADGPGKVLYRRFDTSHRFHIALSHGPQGNTQAGSLGIPAHTLRALMSGESHLIAHI